MTYPNANRLIHLAAFTAAASALITATLIASGTVPASYAAHVIVAGGLAVGVYRRSRICAALLVAYWLGSKMAPLISTPDSFGAVAATTAIAALAAFIGGLCATIVYHRRGLG